jgi:hypothetical protein
LAAEVGTVNRVRRPLAVVACFALTCATAQAASIYDKDIGWPTKLRQELRLERPATRTCDPPFTRERARRQDRTSGSRDPTEALRVIFNYRWGGAWYDGCDGERLKFGVVRVPAARLRRQMRRARKLIARRRLTRDVAFVAVRSSYRELSDTEDRLLEQFAELFDSADLSAGIDTSLNAVVVEIARDVAADDVKRVREAARTAAANVVARRVDEDDLSVQPLG